MENEDIENENYLILKQGGKLPPRHRQQDTGALKEKRRNKKAVKKTKNVQRTVLGAHNLFFNPAEKEIYKVVYDQFRAEIMERKGEVTPADEMLLTNLCIVQLRQYRKTRLESHFNKFMDRQCTQDPTAQTIAILKTLGLTSEKDKNSNNSKELFARMLGKEAEEIDGVKIPSYEEWAAAQGDQEIEMQSFTPDSMASYDTDDILVMDPNEQEMTTLQEKSANNNVV
jgi:hypothetical protein